MQGLEGELKRSAGAKFELGSSFIYLFLITTRPFPPPDSFFHLFSHHHRCPRLVHTSARQPSPFFCIQGVTTSLHFCFLTSPRPSSSTAVMTRLSIVTLVFALAAPSVFALSNHAARSGAHDKFAHAHGSLNITERGNAPQSDWKLNKRFDGARCTNYVAGL